MMATTRQAARVPAAVTPGGAQAERAQLRILILAGRDPSHPQAAGGDLQAWEWARWLAGRGHEVHFLSQAHPSLSEREHSNGVQVVRLRGGLGLPWRAWRYHRAARDAFDLVYEDPIGAGRPPYFSPVWSGAPVIAVWHQVSRQLLTELYPRPVAAILRRAERMIAILYRRCFLWAPSAETAHAVVCELGFEESRVRVVHPTRELGKDPGAPSSGTSERKHILALGLFRPYKAFDHAIRALPAVLHEAPAACLTIAGRRSDDGYEQEMRALAATLGVQRQVSFVTDLSEEEKRRLLATTDLMVLPSLLEGYGIVTIEANEVNVPVIASSGVPVAAVQDGVNGLRYDFGDITQLSRLISRCLTDDLAYASLVSGCRTHAEGRTVAAMSPKFASLVEAALDAGPVSPFRVGRFRSQRRRLRAPSPDQSQMGGPAKVRPRV
jgi:glycosyltransferase involved in cell wall biosynthesis